MELLDFDRAKSANNLRERGIGFERFADMNLATAISIDDDRKNYFERRLRVLGLIESKLYAAVVTHRGTTIRVISLRRANRREGRRYAKERQPP